MYATEQDIIDRYSDDELLIAFDRDGSGMADPGAVTRALTDASSMIDAYLTARYQLPLQTVPDILVPVCVDIALYKGSISTAQTDEKRQRYQDAIKLLDKVAQGLIKLGLDPETAPSQQADILLDAPGKLFGRDTLERF